MVGTARVVDKQRRMAHTIKVGKKFSECKRREQTGKKEVLYSEEKEPDQWDALLAEISSGELPRDCMDSAIRSQLTLQET